MSPRSARRPLPLRRALRTAALALVLLVPAALVVSGVAKRHATALADAGVGTRPESSWFVVDDREASLLAEDRIGRVGFPGRLPRPISRSELELPPGHPLQVAGGVLVVGTIIGPSGSIAKARVLRGLATPALRARLIDCLRKWRFEPASYRGEPWAVEWPLTFEFWPPGRSVSRSREASAPGPSVEPTSPRPAGPPQGANRG